MRVMRAVGAGVLAALVWAGSAAAKGDDLRGVALTVGGGMEGYTGQRSDVLEPGVAWGATAALRPSRVVGLELQYQGAAHALDEALGTVAGTPVVRNGGQAVLTLGLTASRLQPYVLGGVGISRFSVSAAAEALGLEDDTTGNVPLGGGLRLFAGTFVADLRVNYNLLFDDQVSVGLQRAPLDVNSSNTSGSVSGLLQVGAVLF